jgi:plastocyanin
MTTTDQLDSRALRLTDCFGQRFMRPGEYRYALAASGAGDAVDELPFVVRAVETTTKGKPVAPTGIGQTTLDVHWDGRRFVPDRPDVTVQVGDMVMWHGSDLAGRPFVVRGEKEFFASDRLLNESGYSHVFSAPGAYTWADAYGSGLRGVVHVALPAVRTQEDVAKWRSRLATGTVVTIAGDKAEPAEVKVVLGQTVFFVVTKGSGISITDTDLLAAPPVPTRGGGTVASDDEPRPTTTAKRTKKTAKTRSKA